ncbi:efflux transporter periplasmic adaptor subunit [Acidihalobacter yilgarnensis]|uniref:Efflux transporter periplasmic adaptor subunit n=1 Tax=Acidihalobacter yilgarnensis TaxID=2819280 RepID=A0A1D8ILB9_9GAMM|nr:efflux RND transporter periplasmic adaptor subunit [Acidihalobacter yilgarnensis]AOU97191.1 efflux transporter periplasmic adaptor subunit [Acidihalobacter yilgarnensis]
MRLFRPRYLILLLILVVVAALAIWLSRPNPVTVTVQPVKAGLVEATVSNTRAGTVKACRRAKLSPGTGGQIEQLDVHKGEHVDRGQKLLSLWNADLKAQLALARDDAQVAAAQARSVCLQAAVAAREAGRQTTLRRRGMVSAEQTDKAESAAQARAADCEAATASSQAAVARIDLAQANLARTVLTAPFAGVVAEINGEVNEYVTPSPPGIPTPPVIDLIDNSCFYVAAPIDEVDATKVRVGLPVRITLDAFGKRHFEGSVSRIGAYVVDLEKQARTVDVDVRFAHGSDPKQLLAGYSADVEIILQSRKDVLRIPTEAVINGDQVYVYDPDEHILHLTRFKPGIANWAWTEVLSGLKAGEQVVTNVDRKGIIDGALARIEPTDGL